MNSDTNNFSSEYSRKEVDFLRSMVDRPEPENSKSEIPESWIVLIVTPNVDRGIAVCSQLRARLGERVKVIRVDKPATISTLKATFDPEVILSDSYSILNSKFLPEGELNKMLNGIALFLNKKDSAFSEWILQNSHNQSFFDAWDVLNHS